MSLKSPISRARGTSPAPIRRYPNGPPSTSKSKPQLPPAGRQLGPARLILPNKKLAPKLPAYHIVIFFVLSSCNSKEQPPPEAPPKNLRKRGFRGNLNKMKGVPEFQRSNCNTVFEISLKNNGSGRVQRIREDQGLPMTKSS